MGLRGEESDTGIIIFWYLPQAPKSDRKGIEKKIIEPREL